MKTYLSLGIGDLFFLDSILTKEEKESISEIYWACRFGKVVAPLMENNPSYPNLIFQHTIDDEIDRRLLADDVSKAMKDLTEREICVLEHRFGLNGKEVLSLKKVGEKFNVEAETIRQVEARVLRKLRHPSRAGKLREYL